MSEFDKISFNKFANSHLFNSEIESLIIEYCDKNNLILPDNFRRCHYEFYSRESPRYCFEYSFVFIARFKTADDILREQIEFQIKQLEE